MIEAAYVGTGGPHVYGNLDANPIPLGALLSGTAGNADLSEPVQRVALDNPTLNAFRAYPAYQGLWFSAAEGRSRYDALQLTLSRPGGRLQYLAAYTYSRNTSTQMGLPAVRTRTRSVPRGRMACWPSTSPTTW